jgi:hypothetical protein
MSDQATNHFPRWVMEAAVGRVAKMRKFHADRSLSEENARGGPSETVVSARGGSALQRGMRRVEGSWTSPDEIIASRLDTSPIVPTVRPE